MTTVNTLKTSIVIEPSKLIGNIDLVILSSLRSFVNNTCDKMYGYIINVIDVIEYDNMISNATSSTVFTVIYTALCLKPEQNQKYEAIVNNVTADGIFALIANKSRTLVPILNAIPYKFNGVDAYVNQTGDKIKIGDTINVEVKITRYENRNFTCIAGLVS